MHPTTLIDLINKKKSVDDRGITFIEGSANEEFLSYQQLYLQALKALFHLQQNDVHAGDEVILQIEDNKTFLVVFWACILGKIIPVPLTTGQSDDVRQKVFNVWLTLKKPYLFTSRKNLDGLMVFANAENLEEVYLKIAERAIVPVDFLSIQSDGQIADVSEEDIAFVQFSSGSTGTPKGVVLKHKNLMANIVAMTRASDFSAVDRMLSWMPLTHDMGLIGFHLDPLYSGMQQFIMPTHLFIRNPTLWMEMVSSKRITRIGSPNFGYRYFIKHCNLASHNHWDLSCVRTIYNGAEPISKKVCDEFLTALAPFGLKRTAMCPVYGLAEACLAVCFPPLDEPMVTVDVDRRATEIGQTVVMSEAENTISFVSVGRPIDFCFIKIVDNDNKVVDNSVIGHILIKGENVTEDYYHAYPDAKKERADEWLDTGDLGFIHQCSLFVTGRAKDIIFVNGQNVYPHDVERVAEDVNGIELNKVAVAGVFDADSQKEETIAFVFHRGNLEKFVNLAQALRAHINVKMGFELDKIIPVKDIPRTTSGKLQRYLLLDQYKRGDFKDAEFFLKQNLPSRQVSPASQNANDTEQRVLKIWQEVLNHEPIDITQNFFELGGTSLKLAEVGMKIFKEFNVVLSPADLYEKPTVNMLAGEISKHEKQSYVPIACAGIQKSHPPSSAQTRLYHAWELNKASRAQNIPIAFEITGKVVRGRLEDSIKNLIHRHDCLRTTFAATGTLTCKVHDVTEFILETVERNEVEANAVLRSLVEPFDLVEGPLFRIKLLNLEGRRSLIFLDFHHAIADGISIARFLDELLDLYHGKDLPALSIRYSDYVQWEIQQRHAGVLQMQRSFWLNHLAGELPLLQLPLDFARPLIFDTAGEKTEFQLTKEASDALREFATSRQCTLHALLFTIYTLLLSKYTGMDAVVVGIPVSGRTHPDLQDLQGMLVNNLAIKIEINADDLFDQLLQNVKSKLSVAIGNQAFPFEDLMKDLSITRDVGRNPVFDTMFIYQDMQLRDRDLSEVAFTPYRFSPGISKYDLSIEIFETKNEMVYAIEYCTALFKAETITRLGQHFANLVNEIVSRPSSKISDIPLLSNGEFDDFVWKYNTSERNVPDKTIDRLFREQVEQYPTRIAVAYENDEISFAQLNKRVAQLAGALARYGAKNRLIGISMRRSPDLIVSMLAILRAGGIYLPLDADLPMERLKFLIADSHCSIVLTNDADATRILRHEVRSLEVLNIKDLDSPGRDYLNDDSCSRTDLAYVLYTSGTSGKPKGVMVEHQSLVNYVVWAAAVYVHEVTCCFPFFTSISFDLTITSIFVPLVTGNKIIIYDESDKLLIDKVMDDPRINVVKLTPSHLKIVAERRNGRPSSLSQRRITFIIGGERFSYQLAKAIHLKYNGQADLYNEYGPTEATVGCMIYKFEPHVESASVPIGKPAANTQIYLLDKFLKPVPIGVHGELYIAGAGLARGYLFNEELTKQRFIHNPFATGQRMYKTGDVCRRLPDGNLEFIGRFDQQIKINGFRVELGEVENVLASHPCIAEALVTVHPETGNLCGFYKVKESVKHAALQDYLINRLPHYLLPARLIKIKEFPLTKNGKVDVEKLSRFYKRAARKKVRAPKNHVEELLRRAWVQVLKEEDILVTDNFFELGGDSIKAVQISSLLFDQGISLNVKDILIYHTIAEIARHAILQEAEYSERKNVSGEIGSSPIVRWFLQQNFENPNYYNQSVLLKLNRPAAVHLLEASFTELIAHHDGLKANYDPARNTLFYNENHAGKAFTIGEYFVGENGDDESKLVQLCEQLKSNFDITRTLLLAAAIIKRGNETLLFITAHHLVVDGVSWRILLNDLYTCYTSLEAEKIPALPRTTSSLKEWHAETTRMARSEHYQKEYEYWATAEQYRRSLPFDNEVAKWKEVDAAIIQESLGRERTRLLIQTAQNIRNADVLVVLIRALALTLEEWSGHDQFLIELENHGRHLDNCNVSRTVGWFTAMYPFLLKSTSGKTDDIIKTTKEQLKSVPGQGLGYGFYKYSPDQHAVIGKKTGPELRFNYLGAFGAESNNDLFSWLPISTGRETDAGNKMTTKIEFNLMIISEELFWEIKHNRKAHKPATIEWLSKTFSRHLSEIIITMQSTREVTFTPSDFDAVDLDQEELDALFG